MNSPRYRPEQVTQAPYESDAAAPLGDLRFRALLAPAEWAQLPAAVQRRFSKRLAAGHTAVYTGTVRESTASPAGRMLTQLARLIGAPLPLSRACGAPAVVTVTEDGASGGQIWTRLYGRRRGFPQMIHSAKRFAGPTGLEEHVGCGVGMALTVHVEDAALVFRSAHYFLQAGPFRLRLPAFATPGALTVSHADSGNGRFVFTLTLDHPRFGRLLSQAAEFQDAPS